jgi:hypothetical protein
VKTTFRGPGRDQARRRAAVNHLARKTKGGGARRKLRALLRRSQSEAERMKLAAGLD